MTAILDLHYNMLGGTYFNRHSLGGASVGCLGGSMRCTEWLLFSWVHLCCVLKFQCFYLALLIRFILSTRALSKLYCIVLYYV